MKIGNPEAAVGVGAVRAQDTAQKNAAETKAAGASAANAGAGAEADASAQVQLSAAASSLLGAAPAEADFDADKVARISQAIDNGSYKVNAEVIADRLIANAQELLGKVGSK
jgi:negative regulator of flagellin synthesis FlgM